MHALIIEGEDLVAVATEDALRKCGFNSFVVVSSAVEAIVAAARRTPDLIIWDVPERPGSDFAAVEHICEGAVVPVVFITARAVEVTQRFPTHRVLEKPFSEAALISAVASAMLEEFESASRKETNVGVRLGSIPITTEVG